MKNGTLRIIGGTWKGRRIAAPPGLDTRPLMDRIKQSLFDWLGQTCAGLAVADTCAGSGSFAFEAASRGARIVHACEPGAQAFTTLSSNHRELGSPAQVCLHRAPFQQVLPNLTALDLVFCDPPFPWFTEDPASIATLLTLASAALASDGTILIRGEQGSSIPVVANLHEHERRTYGRSWVAALQRT